MTMTRKNLQAFADAIKSLPEQPTRDEVIYAVADVCADDNPRFNSWRFEAACKPDKG